MNGNEWRDNGSEKANFLNIGLGPGRVVETRIIPIWYEKSEGIDNKVFVDSFIISVLGMSTCIVNCLW